MGKINLLTSLPVPTRDRFRNPFYHPSSEFRDKKIRGNVQILVGEFHGFGECMGEE